jgi:hypothetical protein
MADEFFYEITHSDGEVIQRVAELSEEQIETLKGHHYWVDRISLSPAVWPWLLGAEDDE